MGNKRFAKVCRVVGRRAPPEKGSFGVCVCARVRACVHACVRACVCVCMCYVAARRLVATMPAQRLRFRAPNIEAGQGRFAPVEEPRGPHPQLHTAKVHLRQPALADGRVLVAVVEAREARKPLQRLRHAGPARHAQPVTPVYIYIYIYILLRQG
jgi:hypothetical protein